MNYQSHIIQILLMDAVIYILVAQVLINTMSVHIEARDFSPEMEKAPQLIGCGAW